MGKNRILKLLRTWLAGSYRYLKGGHPVPGALECLIDFVSSRPTLDVENWLEHLTLKRITPDVARFVFDFFDDREIPIGRVRPGDRLEADLHLTEVLAQEWGDEFQEAFMDRFGVSSLFRPGPPPETLGELVSFVQQELDDWRADATKA
jgi:hypothetical protein